MKDINKKRILIVDDEESIRFTFSAFLEEEGYFVETAESMSECAEKLKTMLFDAVFLDIHLGRDNGIEIIERIKSLQNNCKVVVMTGSLKPSQLVQARKYGAFDFIIKPIQKPSLQYIAEKAVTHQPSSMS